MSHIHDNFWDDCKEEKNKFFAFDPDTKSYSIISNAKKSQKIQKHLNLQLQLNIAINYIMMQ